MMCCWYILPLDVVDDMIIHFLVISVNILNTNRIATLTSRSNQTKGQLNRNKKKVRTVIPNLLKLGSVLVGVHFQLVPNILISTEKFFLP